MFLFIFFFLFLQKTIATSSDMAPLLALREHLDVPLELWPGDVASCKWPGILCDAAGEVVSIDLVSLPDSKNKKRRELPESIGMFSNLHTLSIVFSGVQGRIPNGIGLLSKLKTLMLNDNELDGEIPESIGNCTELAHLYLSRNRFSGYIPRSFVKFHAMERISLAENHGIIGDFPEGIAEGMPVLKKCWFYDLPLLSGAFPLKWATTFELGDFYNTLLTCPPAAENRCFYYMHPH